MLEIKISGKENYNEKTGEFIYTKDTTLLLEHSLVSISKWESETHKPFLDTNQKTNEEVMLYIKCMTITQNVPDDLYRCLTKKDIQQITDYIQDTKTATWFSDDKQKSPKGRTQTITSELIYCWMVQLQIPWECQKWHLNRLLTLIRVINEENKPKKKSNPKDIISRNAELNAQRLKRMKSSG